MTARSELEKHPRPSVAVDVVALTVVDTSLRVAVYERTIAPQAGHFALPGGFMRIDETLEEAAARLLLQKAGLEGVFIEQLCTLSDLNRDPRGRVLTVAYYALVDAARFEANQPLARIRVPWRGETGGAVDLEDARGRVLPMFVDHAEIVGLAVRRLRGKLDYSPIGFQLLPPEFTLRDLQRVHEVVRDEALNKDSFRRRMLATGLLEMTGSHERDVLHRPAELYRFARRSAV